MKTELNPDERLCQSRETLRLALGKRTPSKGDGAQPEAEPSPADGLSRVNLIRDFLLIGSHRQPWRFGLQFAAQAGKIALLPTAQRHPFMLVAGAATAGAILVTLHPWRWISLSALLTGLLPQLMPSVTKRRPSLRQEL